MIFAAELNNKNSCWLIVNGRKTQTRRQVKPGQKANFSQESEITQVVDATGRIIYAVGKTYAVVPGRGQPAIRVHPEREPYEISGVTYFRRLPDGQHWESNLGDWYSQDFLEEDGWKPVRIKITRIRAQDVVMITSEDAVAEGLFTSTEPDADYLRWWATHYDPGAYEADGMLTTRGVVERPRHRWKAWVLDFEVVK